MTIARRFARFVRGSVRLVLRGNGVYWAWIAVLVALIGVGRRWPTSSRSQTGLIAHRACATR